MAGVAEYPVDAADRWDAAGVAHPLRQQLVPDLPREEVGVLGLQPEDALHHGRGGDLLEVGKKERKMFIPVFHIVLLRNLRKRS